MKKELIVFITPSLGAGGIERIVSNLANYLIGNTDYKVKIICFGSKEIFYPINKNIEVLTLPSSSFSFFNLILKLLVLRKFLRKLKPKAMISFGSMYNSFFLLSSLGLQGKKIVSDRSNPWRNSKLVLKRGGDERHDGIHHYFLKQWLYRSADKILAQTQLSVEIEEKNFGSKKVLYFPNPVEPVDKLNRRKEKIILNVGRFVKSKRQKDLLRIYSNLSLDIRREWRLVFLGGGDEYFQESIDLASELGIQDQVEFLGYEKDVKYWYSIADVFAFTSSSEGFPNSLAEAMAHGCACVSYNCVAGPADLITNQKNGLLIPVGDQTGFTNALNHLLTDEKLRLNLQLRASEITSKFEFEKITQKLIDELS